MANLTRSIIRLGWVLFGIFMLIQGFVLGDWMESIVGIGVIFLMQNAEEK